MGWLSNSEKGGRDGLFGKPGHLSLAPEPTQRWTETTDSSKFSSHLHMCHVFPPPRLLTNNFGPHKMFQEMKVPASELTTEFDPKDSPRGKRALTPTGLPLASAGLNVCRDMYIYVPPHGKITYFFSLKEGQITSTAMEGGIALQIRKNSPAKQGSMAPQSGRVWDI